MATSPDAIAQLIAEATAPGFRDDLLAKGQARSMVWRDGVLPPDAPQFSTLLTYDLLSYAYSLMNQGLRLLDQGAELAAARSAFEHAASAIEAAIARGRPNAERDFHRLLAAACYHLARFAARAFSLLHEGLAKANLSLSERAIALLMLRDLDALEALIVGQRMADGSSEDAMIARLDNSGELDDPDGDGGADALLTVVDQALTDNFMGALAIALLAFERGAPDLIDTAIGRLNIGLASAAELSLVPSWWCHRLAIHLLGDLWSSSFHVRLPKAPTDSADDWTAYRELFIATLLRRGRAEIDLWPSQIDAATRAINLADNMVVSLPTSAGKTRVAELCILACLAAGRRVVFVTPLRALSAQTEVTLQRTFQPLGKTVSSLYGAIGVSDVDEDFLRESDIIVATPEKLDFALRNDPDLLDTVGLVVLDEGHMIGLTEREVRYEVQIQRLLRRSDAKTRRIVCLSAILPDGDQLQDFTAWLTGAGGGAHRVGGGFESGLLRLLLSLVRRMVQKTKAKDVATMVAYLAGVTAWDFPVLTTEGLDLAEAERGRWTGYLTTLDTALLSMLGEQDVPDDQVETMLDDVLSSSLWSRRLLRRNAPLQKLLTAGLAARAKFIWGRTTPTQRRGYFLAGVGLATGEALDAAAADLNELLATANNAVLLEESDQAIAAITTFAEHVFAIAPFVPDDLPVNWKHILKAWLSGEALATLAVGQEDAVLKFVEQALVYRLPWAMEAVRVRALAHDDELETGLAMEDLELSVAVAAVETGSLNISAAMLMHAGFSSRLAAIRAVTQTGADFTTMAGLRSWLREDEVAAGMDDPNWPSPESHGLWLQFMDNMAPARRRTWTSSDHNLAVLWEGHDPDIEVPVRLLDKDGETLVCSPDGSLLGRLAQPINPQRLGVVVATTTWDDDVLHVRYLGPGDLILK